MKLIPDAMAQAAPPAPNAVPAPAPAAPTPPVPALPSAPTGASTTPIPPTGAQTSVAVNGGPDKAEPPSLPDLLSQIVPIFVVMAIVYVLVIRPRARKEKEQLAQLRNVRRGDTLVTSSGFVGRVTRSIDDAEVELELAPNVRVRLLRSAIVEVRSRGEPVKDEPGPAKTGESKQAPAASNDSKPGAKSGGGRSVGKSAGKANVAKTGDTNTGSQG